MKLLIIFLFAITTYSQQKLAVVYVNHETGSDSNADCSPIKPLKSFAKAMSLINVSGTIYIQKTSKPYTETLQITVGGTKSKPLKVIADNATIDLGIDISKGPWEKSGNFYILNKKVNRTFKDSQRAALFVDTIPIHPYNKNLPEKYYMSSLDDGRIKVLFPPGKSPLSNNCRIILNSPPYSNGVSFGNKASNIEIQGISVKHTGNDGFNLHGSSKNITLKNVVTAFNGDEGISAHEDIELKVYNSIIAYNGSSAGGVADVNESITMYKNCLLANNYASAFFFSGKEHNITDCVVWGNKSKLTIRSGAKVTQQNIFEFRTESEAQNKLQSLPKPLKKLILKYPNLKF